MYITAQGPRLRNDLYCVEWDVKLYYTILYRDQEHAVKTLYRLATADYRQTNEWRESEREREGRETDSSSNYDTSRDRGDTSESSG